MPDEALIRDANIVFIQHSPHSTGASAQTASIASVTRDLTQVCHWWHAD